MKLFSQITPRALAALSGVLLVLACPPFDLYYLAWAGLIPLLLALEKPVKSGFIEGFIAGSIFNLGILYWLALNSGTNFFTAALTMIAAVGILTLSWGTAALIYVKLRNRIGRKALWLVPFSWTAWEGWLGNLGELGFPWPLLSLTQNGFDAVLQIMEFTGIWGVTFWVTMINVAILFIWKSITHKERRSAIIVFVLLIIIPPLALFNAYRFYRPINDFVRVAAIQGDVAPDEKWTHGILFSYSKYDSLTRIAASKWDLDLVIWPETAVPSYLSVQGHFTASLTQLANDTKTTILTGASGYTRTNGENRSLNAAYLITPDRGIADQYAKRQLVPFGERVPFQWLIPKLGNLNFGQAEFLPGPRPTIFGIPAFNIIAMFPALICFESAFPKLTRENVLNGANFLTTISNDAWYGISSENAQIAAISRYRSIETRRSMARASNNGVSFMCDPLGRIVNRTKLYQPDITVAKLPLITELTFYTKHGDLFLLTITIIFGIFLLGSGLGYIR